jgi:coenzyme F420-reducing hydrogenase beta subunit
MYLPKDKKYCCGCTACVAICPKNAVTMTPDEDGFLYPVVEKTKCVHCGLCEQVCAYRNNLPYQSKKEVYTAVSTCTDVRESASGGLFAAFAQAVLKQGGVVYGCAMEYENGRFWPRHICVTDTKDLIKLKGSKYVQSDMGDTYPDVRKQLEAGQLVLFSGTPCQVAGLRGYLRKKYDNLYTIDIICHGVTSVKLFHDYISFEENKHGAQITDFRFRDKSRGWKLQGAMILDNGKTLCFEPEESSYYQMFLNSYTYRENCYSCPYASDHRPGDITIGDYWCVELVHPELLKENGGQLDHEAGVSCLIINSLKGQQMLHEFGGGIVRWASSYESVSKYNRQLTAPSEHKLEREIVLSLCREDYAEADKWYRRRLRPIKIKRVIRAAVPRAVKNLIKKVLRKQ